MAFNNPWVAKAFFAKKKKIDAQRAAEKALIPEPELSAALQFMAKKSMKGKCSNCGKRPYKASDSRIWNRLSYWINGERYLDSLAQKGVPVSTLEILLKTAEVLCSSCSRTNK